MFAMTQQFPNRGLVIDNQDDDDDFDMEADIGEEKMAVNKVEQAQDRLKMPP